MRALALAVLAGGVVLPVDRVAIQQALAIANSAIESTHRQFHADYRVAVSQAPVDFISIVSPFRRLVLAAETEVRLGRRMFGQREAMAALQPDPDRFEVYVEMTFHPHNTFVGVPDYTVHLEPLGTRDAAAVAEAIDRLPRFGPRVEEPWYPFHYPPPTATRVRTGSDPLHGGTLVARFAGDRLDPKGAYIVTVLDGTKRLAHVRIDLGRLR